MLSSARTSSSGVTSAVVSSTSQGASRSRFSVLLPRPVASAGLCTPSRPTTSTHGFVLRAWSSTFWNALPSSSVLVHSTPASRAICSATFRCDW